MSEVSGQEKGRASTVGSRPSGPSMAANTNAQSSTLRHNGPSLSNDHAKGMHPARETRPNVGRKPVVPQRLAGDTIDPKVSLPSAKGTRPAVVAAADPADEPLLPSSRSQGFQVLPPNHSSPIAIAPSDSLATKTAPAAASRSATVAVCSRT